MMVEKEHGWIETRQALTIPRLPRFFTLPFLSGTYSLGLKAQ
jgi:hypothetical protein